MADLTRDWNDLATNIRGVGTDSFNAQLGLARLMSEDQVREADVALKNVQKEKELIALRESQKREAEYNQPVTLSRALQFMGQGKLTPDTAVKANDIVTTFGYQLADENNPDSLFTKKAKTPVTQSELAMQAPAIAGYALATTDPFIRMGKNLSAIKQQLGATSEGPFMSDQEMSTLATDEGNNKLLEKYNILKSDYERYKSDPSSVYRHQLAELDVVAGHIKSIGGDTSIIESKKKALESVIAQSDKASVDEQQYIAVTPEIAAVTGLQVGTKINQKDITELGKGLTGLEGTKITATAHIKGAEIAAATQRDISNKQISEAKLGAERTNFFNHIDQAIPKLALEQFDKITRKDAAGNYVDDKGEPLSQDIIQKQQRTLNQRMQQETIQRAYDMGQLDRLGINAPDWVDKSPLPIRQEFNSTVQKINSEIGSLTGPNDLEFKKSIATQINLAQFDLKSGDNKKISNAQTQLQGIITRISEYKNKIRKDIPKTIKERSKGLNMEEALRNSNTSIGAGRIY